MFATARSGTPSPSRSPIATELGSVARAEALLVPLERSVAAGSRCRSARSRSSSRKRCSLEPRASGAPCVISPSCEVGRAVPVQIAVAMVAGPARVEALLALEGPVPVADQHAHVVAWLCSPSRGRGAVPVQVADRDVRIDAAAARASGRQRTRPPDASARPRSLLAPSGGGEAARAADPVAVASALLALVARHRKLQQHAHVVAVGSPPRGRGAVPVQVADRDGARPVARAEALLESGTSRPRCRSARSRRRYEMRRPCSPSRGRPRRPRPGRRSRRIAASRPRRSAARSGTSRPRCRSARSRRRFGGFATARSGTPSPSRSPIATERGPSPAPKRCSVWNVPSPLPSSTLTSSLPSFAVARSGTPSPSRSPIATERGASPAPKRCSLWNVPSPLPISTLTSSLLRSPPRGRGRRPRPGRRSRRIAAVARAEALLGLERPVPVADQHAHVVAVFVRHREVGNAVPVQVADRDGARTRRPRRSAARSGTSRPRCRSARSRRCCHRSPPRGRPRRPRPGRRSRRRPARNPRRRWGWIAGRSSTDRTKTAIIDMQRMALS